MSCVEKNWEVHVSSTWSDVEDIFMLEARAGILALRRKTRCVSEHGKRHLLIGDSMTAILAFQKGRASHHGLLRMRRRLCGLSIASNSQVCWRWLASELNPADGPSRGRAGTGHGAAEGSREPVAKTSWRPVAGYEGPGFDRAGAAGEEQRDTPAAHWWPAAAGAGGVPFRPPSRARGRR